MSMTIMRSMTTATIIITITVYLKAMSRRRMR